MIALWAYTSIFLQGQHWENEFVVPFWKRFADGVRAASGARGGKLIVFAEPPIDFADPTSHPTPNLGGGIAPLEGWAYAPHWYEDLVFRNRLNVSK